MSPTTMALILLSITKGLNLQWSTVNIRITCVITQILINLKKVSDCSTHCTLYTEILNQTTSCGAPGSKNLCSLTMGLLISQTSANFLEK